MSPNSYSMSINNMFREKNKIYKQISETLKIYEVKIFYIKSFASKIKSIIKMHLG